ncbi:MAG: OmpA family protein [Clostridia bacterium]|nr:OmpA family protein [Clostridia bacterium]
MRRRDAVPDAAREGEHGGGGHDTGGTMRWLLTYADLITLLMVFFIVLYSISRIDRTRYEQLATVLRASLLTGRAANAAIDLAPVAGQPNAVMPAAGGALVPQLIESASLQVAAAELQRALADLEATGVADVTVESRGLVLRLSQEVLFDLGRAELRPDAMAVLDRIAPTLAGLTNPIEVAGYTDDLPIRGRYPSNWELAAARSLAVLHYLEAKGIAPQRLSAVSYGEWRPRFPNDGEENRRRNRRVELVILRQDDT